MSDLTPKQESFAVNYVRTGIAVEAYRIAYDKPDDARDDWMYVEASQMLDHPKISIRIAELREKARQRDEYTIFSALDELEEARDLALREAQAGAAVSAVNSKVKLLGLDKPRRVEHTGKDGGPIQTEEVSARERIAGKLASLAARGGTDGDTEPAK